MITALGVSLFLGLWLAFILIEKVIPYVKRRRARKAQREAVDAQIRLLNSP